ncbi:hypothetical protein EI613_28740, partial [Azospirillum sp. 412522]
MPAARPEPGRAAPWLDRAVRPDSKPVPAARLCRKGHQTSGDDFMEYFLQQLINGLSLGAIYGLIAIGYTMV